MVIHKPNMETENILYTASNNEEVEHENIYISMQDISNTRQQTTSAKKDSLPDAIKSWINKIRKFIPLAFIFILLLITIAVLFSHVSSILVITTKKVSCRIIEGGQQGGSKLELYLQLFS